MQVQALLDKIKRKQQTIDDLLDLGCIKKIEPGVTAFNEGKIQKVNMLYDKEANVVLVHFPEKGTYFPFHTHGESVEYVLMIQGSLRVEFPEGGYRKAKAKECVSIEPNTEHSVEILEPDTKFIIVCIPKDHAISKLGD